MPAPQPISDAFYDIGVWLGSRAPSVLVIVGLAVVLDAVLVRILPRLVRGPARIVVVATGVVLALTYGGAGVSVALTMCVLVGGTAALAMEVPLTNSLCGWWLVTGGALNVGDTVSMHEAGYGGTWRLEAVDPVRVLLRAHPPDAANKRLSVPAAVFVRRTYTHCARRV